MADHPSFGAVLSWDPAAGTGYTAIGQVKDISGPNISRADIDVTNHDDKLTGGSGYRTFIPGLSDAGDISFTLGWDPLLTAHSQAVGSGLIESMEDEGCTIPTWELSLPLCGGTAVWTFSAYVNNFSPSSPVEGQLEADVGVKISGKPTLTVT